MFLAAMIQQIYDMMVDQMTQHLHDFVEGNGLPNFEGDVKSKNSTLELEPLQMSALIALEKPKTISIDCLARTRL